MPPAYRSQTPSSMNVNRTRNRLSANFGSISQHVTSDLGSLVSLAKPRERRCQDPKRGGVARIRPKALLAREADFQTFQHEQASAMPPARSHPGAIRTATKRAAPRDVARSTSVQANSRYATRLSPRDFNDATTGPRPAQNVPLPETASWPAAAQQPQEKDEHTKTALKRCPSGMPTANPPPGPALPPTVLSTGGEKTGLSDGSARCTRRRRPLPSVSPVEAAKRSSLFTIAPNA